jgi:hypothetical protein
MSSEMRDCIIFWVLGIVCAVLILLMGLGNSHARPSEKWAQASPERQEFFKKAMRPDYLPSQYPCCGESDAYEADDFETDPDGNLYAILTCNDEATCQPPDADKAIALGTRILIKPEKLLPPPPTEPANLTGHGIVFVTADGRNVFCFALPGGY